MNILALNIYKTGLSRNSSPNNASLSSINGVDSRINNIGEFPRYYCPNINFNSSKFGSIDFEFDFYNVANDVVKNHLSEMDLTKDLSPNQQCSFRRNLFDTDKLTLLNFLFDAKPAILLTGNYPYFKNNEKYDFVTRTITTPVKNNKNVKNKNVFILNKDLVKQTIVENKELYTKRMEMNDDASIDSIYDVLVSKDSPLKKQSGYDDIIGVTLGFSPINSILFQLENDYPNKFEIRSKSNYPYLLDKAFNSENSVYSDFSDDFRSKVQSSIDFLKKNSFRKPNLSPIGYAYIHIAPDEAHHNKIIKKSEEVYERAKELCN